MAVKMPKMWTNHKKSPTNPDKKEQHKERKTKAQMQRHIAEIDWEQQLKDYNNNVHTTN